MNQYLKEAQDLKETLVGYRRHIHENPEITDELPNTVAFVKEQLTAMGYETELIAKSALVAYVGKPTGKTILLRADMDALPMKETSGLDFASKNDYAHTCGHDLHTTILLGAAQLLKNHESELQGRVKLMFQPNEEGLTGAVSMVEAGILDDVDVAYASHVFPGDLHSGMLAVAPGAIMASQDRFHIHIEGKGGHGAMPNTGIDPINVAAHIHIALQEINAREVDPQQPLVITVGQFNAGNAPNIIPQTAELSGTIRAFSPEVRELAKKRLVEISQGIAASFRATATVEYSSAAPSVVNNPELLAEIRPYLEESNEMVVSMSPVMGSEDFAFVSDRVPSVYTALGAGGEDPIYHRGSNHNPNIVFNEDALIYGAATYATVATEWLKNNS